MSTLLLLPELTRETWISRAMKRLMRWHGDDPETISEDIRPNYREWAECLYEELFDIEDVWDFNGNPEAAADYDISCGL